MKAALTLAILASCATPTASSTPAPSSATSQGSIAPHQVAYTLIVQRNTNGTYTVFIPPNEVGWYDSNPDLGAKWGTEVAGGSGSGATIDAAVAAMKLNLNAKVWGMK